jgi:regulator of nucleoside diphosphate kinase
MKKRKIFITENDHRRLTTLLEEAQSFNDRDRDDLKSLKAELGTAKVVESREIPPTIITMNSKLRFVDLEDQSETTVTLVFPSDANIDEGKMSVLSPIGTALLGYAKGDTLKWAVPAGLRRIKIQDILYQPEAAGDYHL